MCRYLRMLMSPREDGQFKFLNEPQFYSFRPHLVFRGCAHSPDRSMDLAAPCAPFTALAPDPLWTRLCVFCCNAAIQGHEKKLMANPASDSSASFDYDYVIIGSGFGGSVSALRLTEKGYRVLVLEKGMRLGAADFPKSNWDLKRWLWLPSMRCFGLFKLTFFRHVGVLSGVGVGGGSLVYANTLPIPKKNFFSSPSWAHLADWETELQPYYRTALRMLGAATNPRLETGDIALRELGRQIGMEQHFEATEVSVFFGKPAETVSDPYFGGKGPERAGCIFCGGCMTGCRPVSYTHLRAH